MDVTTTASLTADVVELVERHPPEIWRAAYERTDDPDMSDVFLAFEQIARIRVAEVAAYHARMQALQAERRHSKGWR